jgi:hypothetical protein
MFDVVQRMARHDAAMAVVVKGKGRGRPSEIIGVISKEDVRGFGRRKHQAVHLLAGVGGRADITELWIIMLATFDNTALTSLAPVSHARGATTQRARRHERCYGTSPAALRADYTFNG